MVFIKFGTFALDVAPLLKKAKLRSRIALYSFFCMVVSSTYRYKSIKDKHFQNWLFLINVIINNTKGRNKHPTSMMVSSLGAMFFSTSSLSLLNIIGFRSW